MSSHVEGFFRDILANPDDDTPRLIYADWLDDQGDSARAEFIRVQCELSRLKQAGKRDENLVQREAALLTENQAKWAKPLVSRLYHAEFERGFLSQRSARELAGRMARLRVPSKLNPLFEEDGPDLHLCELMACLIQELVLRQKCDPQSPRLLETWNLLKRVGHPLAWLPLTLERWESRYTIQHRSASLIPLSEGSEFRLPDADDIIVPLENVTTEEAESRILSAVRNWDQESNGEIEAAVYESRTRRLDQLISIPLLNSAGGDICDGIDRLTGYHLQESFLQLLQAACFGGVYNHGVGSLALGRLLAWQSLAGLVGASPEASAEEVARLAEHCFWLGFHSREFEGMVDIGLIAIRPDGLSMAILMGTDVD